MKKRYLPVIVILIFSTQKSFSQTNFEWDVIIDSLTETQSNLYSKTKLFIAETWNSAQNVIQNDDAEKGLILVKGISNQNLFYQLSEHKWNFSYTVKFMLKENKCRIIINNVYCVEARTGKFDWPLVPVSDNYPADGWKKTSLSDKRYLELMSNLKSDLQKIVTSYNSYLNSPSVIDSDW